jgi:hypothetical protein
MWVSGVYWRSGGPGFDYVSRNPGFKSLIVTQPDVMRSQQFKHTYCKQREY